jgi:hypothetical protein
MTNPTLAALIALDARRAAKTIETRENASADYHTLSAMVGRAVVTNYGLAGTIEGATHDLPYAASCHAYIRDTAGVLRCVPAQCVPGTAANAAYLRAVAS